MPALLPAGLEPQEHMLRAAEISSPFAAYHVDDDDVFFAAQAMVALGPAIAVWRAEQRAALEAVAAAMLPLEVALRRAMPAHMLEAPKPTARAVLAMATVLLRWPHRQQPWKYAVGFQVVRELESSGIFREVQQPLDGSRALDKLSGPVAAEANACLLEWQPRWQDVDSIERLTEAEQEAG